MPDQRFGTIIQIGNCLISEEVITEFFCCDYAVCRGACCIEGDSGAPLEEEELDMIERQYDVFSPLMSQEGRDAAERTGFFEIDRDGDLVTPVVPVTNECAYAHMAEDGSCLCSMEKCYCEGRCSWPKPISCALYPIRITKLTGGGLALNVHHWDICKPAFEKGRQEGVRVYQFLKGPLTRKFGEEFYEMLCAAASSLMTSLESPSM